MAVPPPAKYAIVVGRSVERDLRRIPRTELKRLLNRIAALANDPRPPGCIKLAGEDLYRIRHGRYRIIYSIEDDELRVLVVAVGHRKDIYRKG